MASIFLKVTIRRSSVTGMWRVTGVDHDGNDYEAVGPVLGPVLDAFAGRFEKYVDTIIQLEEIST